MSYFKFPVAFSLLMLYQIQMTLTKNDCKSHYSGICVSIREKCPFVNGKEVKSVLGERDLCEGSFEPRRCCVPPSKPQVNRKDKSCGIRNIPMSRIVGGDPSTSLKYPWHANMIKLGKFWCGGSIIHEKWILTAAHCLEKVVQSKDLQIVVGNYTRSLQGNPHQIVSVKSFYVHKYFEMSHEVSVNLSYPHDIALIELEHEVKRGPHVATVCLPNVDEDFENMFCTTTGFGQLEFLADSSEILQEVYLPIISSKKCAEWYKKYIDLMSPTPRNRVIINYEHICGGYQLGQKSSCRGDSGGSLVCLKKDRQNFNQFIQSGIVSFGGNGCAYPEAPTIFTRVTKYLEWIEYITKLPFFDGSYAANPLKQYIYRNVTRVLV